MNIGNEMQKKLNPPAPPAPKPAPMSKPVEGVVPSMQQRVKNLAIKSAQVEAGRKG